MPSSNLNTAQKKALWPLPPQAWAAFTLIITVAVLVWVDLDNLWGHIDVTLHYALASRISESWALPNGYDPSLEELSFYPRTSHMLAAAIGKLTGSPLYGMQSVALGSLAAIWASLGYAYFSLPRRIKWLAFGAALGLLVANRYFIHLETFGHEIVVNYFYPQLMAQGIALALLAGALYLEKSGRTRALGYLVLAGMAPFMPQLHLVPGAEVLGCLGLLVAVNALDTSDPERRNLLRIGGLMFVSSLAFTLLNPAFRRMIELSANEGQLVLRYTGTLPALALESAVVILLSAVLIAQWLSVRSAEARTARLPLKYLGVFGLAAGGLCITQILALQLGFGSEYACKKYAFALNTLVLLDLPLLVAGAIASQRGPAAWVKQERASLPGETADFAYIPLFLVAAFLLVLPSRTARFGSVGEVVRAERFALQYRQEIPGADGGRYDLALGLVDSHPGFDFMISIGVLRAPRSGNAEDFLLEGVLSKPAKLGRIFSQSGAKPWDVWMCRQVVSPDGFLVLDGQCVLESLGTTYR